MLKIQTSMLKKFSVKNNLARILTKQAAFSSQLWTPRAHSSLSLQTPPILKFPSLQLQSYPPTVLQNFEKKQKKMLKIREKGAKKKVLTISGKKYFESRIRIWDTPNFAYPYFWNTALQYYSHILHYRHNYAFSSYIHPNRRTNLAILLAKNTRPYKYICSWETSYEI